MSNPGDSLSGCFESIGERIPFTPKIALVLGSGLGAFAERAENAVQIPYEEIEGFPQSTVAGHAGRFVFGHLSGVPLVIMQGRVHFYEGYSMQEVVLPARLMRRMGAEILFLTNAAGGLNPAFGAGDLMMITDQIASFVPSPLLGPNDDTLGTRFPDMSAIYDPALCALIRESAGEAGIRLQEGVYLQTTGPQYESPSEVRMFRMLGADAVGMSTACEAIAARHAGMRICGISLITNAAAGLSSAALSHEEVQAAADASAKRFGELVARSVEKMGQA